MKRKKREISTSRSKNDGIVTSAAGSANSALRPSKVSAGAAIPQGRAEREIQTSDASSRDDVSRPRSSLFPIVGIGASAGGLEAFSELLSHLPVDTGMAFILVQHLAPGHESILAKLLAPTTAMPVREVKQGMPVEPNQVYVIPPNTSLTISAGTLQLGARQRAAGGMRSINVFFQSLAEECGSLAMGVVLSGTDFDGTAGVQAIKERGGITFAQDEKTARFDSMPRSAAASGHVDFVLRPEGIARELGRLAASIRVGTDTGAASAAGEDPVLFRKILQQIRIGKGVDFALYKPSTVQRRIQRRMVLQKIDKPDRYLKYLRNHPGEVDALYQDILISVTGFFRDPQVFEELKEKVFPSIIRQRTPDDPVRIWVAGCSLGQEAYSIAMAFLEFAGSARSQIPLQIFATDINEALLEKARAGRYSRGEVQELSPDRLRRFFVQQDGGFQVCKPIREVCIFARHDLARDPAFSRMDLVSCRNMLIYFQPSLQKKVIPTLHYALKPGGFAVLGTSETVGDFADLFVQESKRYQIYVKKPAAGVRPHPGHLPDRMVSVPGKKSAHPTPPLSVEGEAQREADQIALASTRRWAWW